MSPDSNRKPLNPFTFTLWARDTLRITILAFGMMLGALRGESARERSKALVTPFEEYVVKARFSLGYMKTPNLFKESIEFRVIESGCWLVRRAVGLALWLAGAILATIRRISGRVDGLFQFVFWNCAIRWIFTLVFEVCVCVLLHVLAVLVNWVQHDPLFSVPKVSLSPSGEAPPLKKRPTRSSKGNCALCRWFYATAPVVIDSVRSRSFSHTSAAPRPRFLSGVSEKKTGVEEVLSGNSADELELSEVESFDVRDIKNFRDL